MAIAAQRNKVLDRETNLAVMDFNDIKDNDSYNAPIAKLTKLAESMSKKAQFVESKIKDVMKAVDEAPAIMMRKLKDLMNNVMDKISKIKLPAFIKNILDKLKSIDLSGFKSFFERILRAGATLLCNNTGMLMGFFAGYAISDNILGGLLMGLFLSWLNRFCSKYNKQTLASFSPLGKLEGLMGSAYGELASNELLGKFIAFNKNGIGPKYPGNQSLPSSITSNEYLSKLFNKGKKEANSYLQRSEISDTHKEKIMNESYAKLSEPTPSLVTVNSKVTSLVGKSKEEALDYSDELGSHYPITDKDTSDLIAITTGNFSEEERAERTQEVISDVMLEHEIDAELVGKLDSLNDLTLAELERNQLITNILEQLDLNGVVSPELEALIRDIGRLGLTEEERTTKLEELLARLTTYTPHEDRESSLLDSLGDLKDLPMISPDRREDVIFNGNLSDRLGDFLIQILKSDLSLININTLSPMERLFLEKLKEMQIAIRNDPSIASKDNSTGNWATVDFSKFFPVLSKEEKDYLDSLPETVDLGTHRPLDIHPTSLVMIGEICA